MPVFEKVSIVPATAAEVFAWHARPGAFARLVPPWECVRQKVEGSVVEGGRVEVEMKIGPLRFPWTAVIDSVTAGRGFVDRQVQGPMRTWVHRHEFDDGEHGCTLRDVVDYETPGGAWLRPFCGGLARRRLERLFAWRHDVTMRDLADLRHAPAGAAKDVVVTGASGLVGRSLQPYLGTRGHRVRAAVRRAASAAAELRWDPAQGLEDDGRPVDAVIHLAGAGVADKRWTTARKEEIRGSRVEPTRALCRELAARRSKPEVLVTASAIGFYGDRPEEIIDESAGRGDGFLADLVNDWEGATRIAADAGIRVVNLRFGVILDPGGGALAKMLPPFKAGVGGRLGSGKQMMSWVARDDVLRAVAHAIENPRCEGAVNVVAPNPVSNQGFTQALARVLGRPALLPMPAFAARAAFGEMAQEMLLSGAAIRPSRLLESGFAFRYTELEPTLRRILGR